MQDLNSENISVRGPYVRGINKQLVEFRFKMDPLWFYLKVEEEALLHHVRCLGVRNLVITHALKKYYRVFFFFTKPRSLEASCGLLLEYYGPHQYWFIVVARPEFYWVGTYSVGVSESSR